MKKVILLLMEGPSDEDALLAPTKAAISDVLVDSECFHTDVTTASLFPHNASFDVSSDVSKTVGDFVDSYLDKNPGYDWGDLAAVIQVIDLDGALVRPDSVIEDWSTHKIQYGDEAISTPDRDFLLRRNRVKTASIKKVVQHRSNRKRSEEDTLSHLLYVSKSGTCPVWHFSRAPR